jgi:hypothetical protein
MTEFVKNYIVMIQMINQVLTNTEVAGDINKSFTDWYKQTSKGIEEATATATATQVVNNSEVVADARNVFISKCTEALKELSREEVYSVGEKLAMMYSFMKKNGGTTEEALERIHPLCTDSFREVLGEDEYTELMNGWQNIIDEKAPSELTLTGIRKDVEVTVEKEKKIKEESDKRFALNIRKKVTATQAALAGKKKMEKAGYIFEEGEGVTLIKKKPEPAKEDTINTGVNIVADAVADNVTETPVEVLSSGGVAESKDD